MPPLLSAELDGVACFPLKPPLGLPSLLGPHGLPSVLALSPSVLALRLEPLEVPSNLRLEKRKALAASATNGLYTTLRFNNDQGMQLAYIVFTNILKNECTAQQLLRHPHAFIEK